MRQISAPARVHLGVLAMSVVSAAASLAAGSTVSAVAVMLMSMLVTWSAGVRTVRLRGFPRLVYGLMLGAFVVLDAVTILWLAVILSGGDKSATNGFVQFLMGVSYLFLLAAAFVVVRRSARQDPGGVLDAATLAIAVASALWQMLLAPALEAADATLAQRAYIFAVVIILSGAIGAVVGLRANGAVPRSAIPVMRYYVGALAVTVAGNALGSVYADPATGVAPSWVGAFWPVAFALAWGALSHPAGPDSLATTPQPNVSRLTSTRILLLGTAVILTPLISVLRTAGGGYVGWLASAGTTITLVMMVLLRVNQLARAHHEAEARLRQLAERDVLTGLPNRRTVDHRLADLVTRVAAGTAPGAIVCFIDLNGFKQINDTRGHAAGDELLVAIATRLDRLVRHNGKDMVGRLGGDEFIMVLEAEPKAEQSVTHRIAKAFEAPFLLSDGYALASASIGLASSSRKTPLTVDALLTRADHAMYRDKRRARAQASDVLS